jgi:nucleoside-diphosphate-sugar epimerase
MILLTGASGFLGRVILDEFQKINLPVITIGRAPDNSIYSDLSIQLPDLPPVETVVHAAGKAHFLPVKLSEKKSFYDTNVEGTKHLLRALEENRMLKKFIFISSVAVYGVTAGQEISEDSPLLAKDPYGKSKLIAEELVQNWCRERNIDYYILRLPLVAGKHPPGNLGEMTNAIKSGKYFSIGPASAKKSMVLASDVARLITSIKGPSGIYNLTDGYHPTFKELEIKIAAHYGKNKPMALPLPIVKLLAYTGDLFGKKFPINSARLNKIISSLTYSDRRARELLQWTPNPVLQSWEID